MPPAHVVSWDGSGPWSRVHSRGHPGATEAVCAARSSHRTATHGAVHRPRGGQQVRRQNSRPRADAELLAIYYEPDSPKRGIMKIFLTVIVVGLLIVILDLVVGIAQIVTAPDGRSPDMVAAQR